MSNITFQCIDTTCEAADQSFFPPRITMQTKSTTQVATVLGFSEYIPSLPPKKYKTLTWQGTSEQQLWRHGTEQIAGARFDYSGSSTIDSQGNYISLYSKNLSTMCSATGGLVTCFIGGVGGGLENYVFTGWLGPTGHQKCAPPGIPYTAFADEAIGKGDAAINDSSSFWGSKKPTPAISNRQVSDFKLISSTQGSCVDVGGDKVSNAFIALFEPVPQGVNPPITNETEGIVWFFAAVVWNHNYTSDLTDEYTDAEALANAKVIVGNGATAQNFQRTTGFVSTFTNVVFTLTMSNLIIGQSYLVTVDFADITSGVTTTRQYGIAATKTSQTLVDTVPTPAQGHSIVVRNPKINFV